MPDLTINTRITFEVSFAVLYSSVGRAWVLQHQASGLDSRDHSYSEYKMYKSFWIIACTKWHILSYTALFSLLLHWCCRDISHCTYIIWTYVSNHVYIITLKPHLECMCGVAMGIQTNKYVYEAYTTKLRYSHRLHDHVKVMNSHLLHFTALTTPDHRQVPLSEVAVRFHGNAWHVAPVCGRRETSELPSPQLEGVMGSAVRVIRGERDREGGGGRVRERR